MINRCADDSLLAYISYRVATFYEPETRKYSTVICSQQNRNLHLDSGALR